MRTKDIIISAMLLLTATTAQAQINIQGKVYGGARQADVKGHTFVNIGADHHDVIIDAVYGGNDIAGTIGQGVKGDVPTELAEAADNGINNTYDAFVSTNAEAEGKHIFIGQLFGGGNGAYDYEDGSASGKYNVTYQETKWDAAANNGKGAFVEGNTTKTNVDKPELAMTYLELKGGTFGYVYGGGNNATVTEATDICIDNDNGEAKRTKIASEGGLAALTTDRLLQMGINTEFYNKGTQKFLFSRVFGGNNLAPMAIQPTWHLNKGTIENLYSGGNEGKMTSETGLLLKINPKLPAGIAAADTIAYKKKLVIDNVFGGCRKANVEPRTRSGALVEHVESPAGTEFPRDYAARIIVFGGDINNVYGGNDVSGRVYFGNAVGIRCDVRGNVYGGGNGSYAYTDNPDLAKDFPLLYGDFYYDPIKLLNLPEGTTYDDITGLQSAQALNLFRPDAEQVSIRVMGKEATKTIIGGSIYCGGNSATLKFDEAKKNDQENYPNYPIVELKIGSYVVANEVFLGNNGAKMVKGKDESIEDCVLYKYAHGVDANGDVTNAASPAYDYSKMQLTNSTQFEEYMEGCAMNMVPSVAFDKSYIEYKSYIGSLYCGGNVGSMTVDGPISIPFNDKVVIFEKVVGGCNNANVPEISGYNAAYNGGLLRAADPTTGNKLELTFNGLKIQPKRWKKENGQYVYGTDGYPLEWHTVKFNTRTNDYEDDYPTDLTDDVDANADDLARRLAGGNIYGGCYNSGHVNGNVVINLDASIVDRDKLFDIVKKDDLGEEESLYGTSLLTPQTYHINERRTGVILGQQGMDVLGKALNVFGGGFGKGSEIWGSTTINLNKGYAFQIFGGGEAGAIGKKETNGAYSYNPEYSCFINLRGNYDGVTKAEDSSDNMAECEFIYGGGFFGTIAGNTVINLGRGRVFNTFGGSCNADILGHTETYIGRQVLENSSKEMLKHYLDHYLEANYTGAVQFQAHDDFYVDGFPYVRDMVYGGNDLGGEIKGETSGGANGADCNFKYRVDESVLDKVHKYDASNNPNPDVLKASAYVEYTQGRADAIFGGCFGTYDYTDAHYGEYFYDSEASDIGSYAPGTARSGYSRPKMNNAFVNFRPITGVSSPYNTVKEVYGAGQGYPDMLERDELQNRSYVLINIPTSMANYQNMKIYGAGAWAGVGMRNQVAPDAEESVRDAASAIIDLMSGKVNAAFGASYKEGFTRRTVVNVPFNSTIDIQKIFGGGEGVDEDNYRNLKPCDAYEANVNYNSKRAIVRGAVYGGNNAYRRTLYGKVNIKSPVYNGESDNNEKPMTTTVYGAGCGENTWSQYTEVNLLEGAEVYEVYGGGQKGKVYNTASLNAWNTPSSMDLSMGSHNYYTEDGLDNALATTNVDGSKHNTNVHIHENAVVDWYYITKTNDNNQQYQTWDGGYAYGGGLGDSGIAGSGDVYGTTYIDLLGGTVRKDIYGAGTQGAVMDNYGVTGAGAFTASSNVFIKGGIARNVYGGGWAGSVGKHEGQQVGTDDEGNPIMDYLTTPYTADIPGETHVVIGTIDGTSFTDGIPAIERNAYGGGEGGAVWGTTHITLNNGYIGYRFFDELSKLETHDGKVVPYETKVIKEGDEVVWTGYYQEKLHDETFYGDQTNRLKDSGCLFGGGYIDNSSVDNTRVVMYGGTVRNSLFGGGEIAAIGRGTVLGIEKERTLTGIYKAGTTNVKMYDGFVKRNVFGGGRGYNNLGEKGRLYSDGYVFGKTEVNIHGGEIGTEDGVARGEGNVFGGGDVGYVYSAYEDASGRLAVGKKSGIRYGTGNDEGYYYKYEGESVALSSGGEFTGGAFVGGSASQLTEDCKVLIEPQCKVTAAGGFRGYAKGEFVPISVLNTLGNKDDQNWHSLEIDKGDDEGIIIHNAVFAGGNVTSGSDKLYANATTVFGNATASIHDVFNRDLITIGTGHTGGLYGDGNLTFVDGYRGLNITNYGTDYYSIQREVRQEVYDELPAREKAYYELRYKYKGETPIRDNAGKEYHCEIKDAQGNITRSASVITLDEFLAVFEGRTDQFDTSGKLPNSAYWEQNGVCSRYMGRIMNTIQRADFCGVFGSRMVMQGAQDRVPSTADTKNYTINRVREVSLNKKNDHGNYFGIYNLVNNLGNLTSDVDFHTTVRTTDADTQKNPQYATDGKTFYEWKKAHHDDRTRNNGKSHNQVALASGVYLEVKDMEILEKKAGAQDGDEWGYITGVVELDLINVQPGIGGGFVYAKNEHGTLESYSKQTYATLTALNAGAVTRKDYTYETDDDDKVEWETSGNFIHSTQVIIDDCYPKSKLYTGSGAMKAHYWFIKGEVYVYDQYITAYTGAANAYNETVDIPLTITAASNGVLKLLNVQPNRYAYYSSHSGSSGTKLGDTDELEINNVKYKLNDPISYWDWYMLSAAEKNLFVDETYVTIAPCTVTLTNGETKTYPEGTVLLPGKADGSEEDTYNYLVQHALSKSLETNKPAVQYVHDTKQNKDVAFDYVFRESNNMSHETGYILTYKVDNPLEWNTWYTEYSDASNDSNKAREKSQSLSALAAETTTVAGQVTKLGPNDGPTYRYVGNGSGELLGQREYNQGNLISEDVYNTYQAAKTAHSSAVPDNQAEFYTAYIMTAEVDEVYKYIYDDEGQRTTTKVNLYSGAAVAQQEYSAADWAKISPYTEAAYVSTKTIKLSETEYIPLNKKMGRTELDSYLNSNAYSEELKAEIRANVVPAYYCTKDGDYGGDYYAAGTNYRGLAAWSSMSADDRNKFTFNYDAFDLLIDSNYGRTEGEKYQYDGVGLTTEDQVRSTNPAGYSVSQPIDYQATYNGDGTNALVYYDAGVNEHTVAIDQELQRTAYENLPNEQRYYSPITIVKNDDGSTCYDYWVVTEEFFTADSNYPVGSVIRQDTFDGLLSDQQRKLKHLIFANTLDVGTTFYYCRQNYTAGEKGGDKNTDGTLKVVIPASATNITGYSAPSTYSASSRNIPAGLIIGADAYASLPNKQKDFSIHGKSPVETSTLFVSRKSDIFDLSKERIITVVYQYDYDESDVTKTHITPMRERHVVNIHIKFESGIPEVEDISAPKIVIPGTGITMMEPFVTPGAYEVTGGGWELFETQSDVESHTNGIEYKPGAPLYWYQDGFYLTYYAETYLGKTYSNEVQVSVANYHDLKSVMDAVTHHYYIDKPNVHRDPKIYINDYSGTNENGLDMLKSLFDLSVLDETKVNTDENGLITTQKVTGTPDSPFKGHALLNDQVKGAQNLEFFLHSNIDHTGSPWTPIGNDNEVDNPATTEVVEGECFQGTLHGDGYYIKGLDNSLFAHLCGQVYNLGVDGSFRGAGVAEEGSGYVENCWIRTSATPTATSTTESGNVVHHYPVFANPLRTGTADLVQVVNCYYPESNTYEAYPTNYALGKATQMPDKSFYNGEVAYNLNGFYLKKRYYNKTQSSGKSYYFFEDVDGTLTMSQNPGYYPAGYAFYPIDAADDDKVRGYVEERFHDGDFVYASGKIPDEDDKRLYVPTSATSTIPQGYYPIWPDDYIFFGQRLTYGHKDKRPHQDVPSHIIRNKAGLVLTALVDEDENEGVVGNRIYRAPAYFRNGKMGVAHFNPYAVFAQTKKGDATTTAYKGMTAIDFTGGNRDVTSGYQAEFVTEAPYNNTDKMPNGAFYPPLLDDWGLSYFENIDLTKNLLAYTGTTSPAVAATDGVVAAALPDWGYDETNSTYKTATPWDRYSSLQKITGHRVVKTGDNYVAQNDHFLMDREDFDAPISYSFASDMRMWYQRDPVVDGHPDWNLKYVGQLKNAAGLYRNDTGWEGISLPFTVELVTTEDKGEITHFYNNSRSVSSSGSKTGHEYWLREYTGGAMSTNQGEQNTVYVANFQYPQSAPSGDPKHIKGDKSYTNTFLWDYYYNYDGRLDYNRDQYQEQEDKQADNSAYTYYKYDRTYSNYLRLGSGTPYIIGFPGERYYEFDLSGSFSPENTNSWVSSRKLSAQHIIFSSKPGATTIAVSDSEKTGVTPSGSKYTFTPSYLNDPELGENKHAFLLNADGNSYVEDGTNTAEAKVTAFRPYFTSTVASSGNARPATRSIIFSNEDSQLKGVDDSRDLNGQEPGTLYISSKKHMIVVESALKRSIDVRIVNPAGITVSTFTVDPGETVETRIVNSGVYIVQSADGRYTKKLSVK